MALYNPIITAPPPPRSIVPFPLLRDASESVIFSSCHLPRKKGQVCRPARQGIAALRYSVLCATQSNKIFRVCVASRTCKPRFAPDACTHAVRRRTRHGVSPCRSPGSWCGL